MRVNRVSLLLLGVIGCNTASEEILEGKRCSADSACVDGYVCDTSTQICVRTVSSADDADDAAGDAGMLPSEDDAFDDTMTDDVPIGGADGLPPEDDDIPPDSSDDDTSDGGSGGTGGAAGGEGGLDMSDAGMVPMGPSTEVAEGVCGNGVVENDEACDDAGLSETCSASCELRSAPSNCDIVLAAGVSYVICRDNEYWEAAQDACAQMGAHLAAVDDLEENGRLIKLANEHDASDYWLGGNDLDDEGTWVWDGTGQTFWQGGEDGAAVDGGFTNWDEEEPNETSGSDCLLKLTDIPGWHDRDCEDEEDYICEFTPAEVPATCGDGVLDSGEACDPLADPSLCDPDCTVARCGDGWVNADAAEHCDDGNQEDGDLCSNECISIPGAATLMGSQMMFNMAGLSWEAPDDGGSAIIGYRVYTQTGMLETADNQVSVTLQFGRNVFYVTAMNEQGEGLPSNIVVMDY